MFHFCEEKIGGWYFSPEKCNGITTIIGLMVADVDSIMAAAVAAGAQMVSPVQDYDYGYRQGIFIDLIGHRWQIEMVL